MIRAKDIPARLLRKLLDETDGVREARSKVALRGSPVKMIWLDLPWPPALNNLYSNTRRGRILSERGKAYKQKVWALLDAQEVGHVQGRLSVEAWAHPPDNRKRDLDGMWKLLLDSLQQGGVFEDDAQVDHLAIHRCAAVAGGKIVVKIEGEMPAART